jgi:DNA-directed RNA polymerase subunit RPC12/RpoP
MECRRCLGFMVEEVFEDVKDDTGAVSFPGWRCVTCGEILDQTILTNRAECPRPFAARARKRRSTIPT